VKPTNELEPLTSALLARFGASDKGLTAAVDLAVLVAMADEHIDEAEMGALLDTIEGLLGVRLAPALAKHLVTDSRVKIRVTGAEARARDIGHTLSVHAAGEEGVRLALAIAWTSEGLADAERAIIGVIAEAAGVSQARVDALAEETKPAEKA
jgi:tellurite resistance protein